MRQNIHKLIIILFCISCVSCKTIQPASANTQQKGETISTYTILIRLQDIDGTVNQVMDKIHEMVTTLNVQVMDKSSFFNNIQEIQVTTDSSSYNRINITWEDLKKIPGVISVFIYKNDRTK